jgi:methylenetetrahydrofolate reductase (NADPH)
MTLTTGAAALLDNFSLEMTARDAPELPGAAKVLPAHTRVNVTFLTTESLAERVAGAKAVLAAGLTPVPHIAARRLTSTDELRQVLGALRDANASGSVFVVGGDPATPEGPFASARDVIETGLLPEFGVTHVSISGYPEGHPDIPDDVLWRELEAKSAALTEQGLESTIITQFGFDEAPILEWLRELRARGITAPVRLGLPGPAGVKRLLGFARRFGISSSAGIVKKYGFSLANLVGTAGPERIFDRRAAGRHPPGPGAGAAHFYTFGGVEATSQWVHNYLA